MADFKYRWIRTSVMGEPDPKSLETALTDGWELVPAIEWPEGMPRKLLGERVTHVLCRLPEAIAQERRSDLDHRNNTAVEKIHDQFLRSDEYNLKFAFYPGHNDPKDDVHFKPFDTAETFYSPANLIAHPERAEELEEYRKYVAEHGERYPGEWFGLPPK